MIKGPFTRTCWRSLKGLHWPKDFLQVGGLFGGRRKPKGHFIGRMTFWMSLKNFYGGLVGSRRKVFNDQRTFYKSEEYLEVV